MATSIVVDPGNSPYVVPAPAVTYDKVTIKPGGTLAFQAPTTMACTTLEKSVTQARSV
ncbi:MAG: hypothetical protein QOG83_275 [Alphaproteobacteria bacterium]|jgi:hypothetical protein|nr:hypothetical protein [Alphaproteobacteria bacterium]MEA2987564.1 hypothetical protein [Alphaproteobacteria bacterium]